MLKTLIFIAGLLLQLIKSGGHFVNVLSNRQDEAVLCHTIVCCWKHSGFQLKAIGNVKLHCI